MRKFYARRAEFGIKRPAFTRGHGGGASPYIQRPFANVRKSCTERTVGVALPLPGRGGGISPHMKTFLRCFLKIISTRSYARKGITWDATSYVAGGVGRASPQNKTPTSKNLCASFPNILSCFFNVFCTFFMPVRAQFGINRPAFTRGHGGGASPYIRSVSPANPRSLYARKGITWDATSYVAGGVGRAAPQNKTPTFKNLYATF